MVNDDYIRFLIERDKPKPPVRPEHDIKLPARKMSVYCPSCGQAMFLGIEQFCFGCGQRFVDSPNQEFYEVREKER